jgi:hypothetical protein
VNRTCTICGDRYVSPARGWDDKYLPPVCSMTCFLSCVYWLQPVRPCAAPFEHSDRSYRSNYEREMAKVFTKFGLPAVFEPYVFHVMKGGGYVPDFFVADRLLVEVKGEWTTEAKTKFKAFVKKFPELPIVVVDREMISRLKKERA